jgi:hypothetical protein
MSPEKFLEAMQPKLDEAMGRVADAVNEAPTGGVIAGSEEQVRDVFATLRQEAYELALQMRVDAAEASFSPSGQRQDGSSSAK